MTKINYPGGHLGYAGPYANLRARKNFEFLRPETASTETRAHGMSINKRASSVKAYHCSTLNEASHARRCYPVRPAM